MQEQLVSYTTVKLAKEVGIDFRSKEFGSTSNRGRAGVYHAYVNQSLLQKYLREKHNLDIAAKKMWRYSVEANNDETFYQSSLMDFNKGRKEYIIFISNEAYGKYEDALEKALQHALIYLKLISE